MNGSGKTPATAGEATAAGASARDCLAAARLSGPTYAGHAGDMVRGTRKRAAARAALEYVQRGAVLGVGTGSTVAYFIAELAETRPPVRAVVASSEHTAALLRVAELPVVDLNEVGAVDVYVDGADQVDPQLRMIKGGGGAHTREKIVAAAAQLFVCIVDDAKMAGRLGGVPLPLAVLPFAKELVRRQVAAMGGTAAERPGFLTDDGHLVLDTSGLDLADPETMELLLDALPGVVECGLFARRPADVLLCGTADGVRVLSRSGG